MLLWQVHERVNDAHYDYDLLHFIDVYMYFFSWWARCLFSIGVVYVVSNKAPSFPGDGRVVRWCWVNFQCRGVLQFGL